MSAELISDPLWVLAVILLVLPQLTLYAVAVEARFSSGVPVKLRVRFVNLTAGTNLAGWWDRMSYRHTFCLFQTVCLGLSQCLHIGAARPLIILWWLSAWVTD